MTNPHESKPWESITLASTEISEEIGRKVVEKVLRHPTVKTAKDAAIILQALGLIDYRKTEPVRWENRGGNIQRTTDPYTY